MSLKTWLSSFGCLLKREGLVQRVRADADLDYLEANTMHKYSTNQTDRKMEVRLLTQEYMMSLDALRTDKSLTPGERLWLQMELTKEYRRYCMQEYYAINAQVQADHEVDRKSIQGGRAVPEDHENRRLNFRESPLPSANRRTKASLGGG
jgi:hypothetical protein